MWKDVSMTGVCDMGGEVEWMRLDRGGGQAGTRSLALFQQTGNLTCQISSLTFSSCGPTSPYPALGGNEERRQDLAAWG